LEDVLFTPNELKHRAIEFSKEHANDCDEKSEAQNFWRDFFNIFGLTPRRIGVFEARAKLLSEHVGFIDFFWPGMLLVEHKSRGKDLDVALKQALDYCASGSLKEEEVPRFVVVSDFARFRIVDLVAYREAGVQLDFVELRADKAREMPLYVEFPLEYLHENLHRFNFILGYEQRLYKEEDPVNIKAAELMGSLHDELKEAGYSGHELELFLVRLMFCFFADDTGIFPRDQFSWLIEAHAREDGRDLGALLAQIFQILNTPSNRRMKTLDAELSLLPYVNGGLFAETLPLPSFNQEMTTKFIKCCHFDWSRVSPAIFGSLFQSVMDAQARRNLGAHYTSEKNIMKTIHGLFLDGYVEAYKNAYGNVGKVTNLLNKIRNTRLLDPACGCGNFLVLAYRELRLLEILCHKEIQRLTKEKYLDLDRYRGIEVENMYGIEIEEFPAQIARTALWIMDHIMNVRLSEEFGEYIVHLPLTSTPHIVQANALRIDWRDIVKPDELNYILGNPPFVGSYLQSKEQKEDTALVFRGENLSGMIDFVGCWYRKASEYIQSTTIKCAFVSTNSITQGEQVPALWGPLLQRYMVHINFAHRTFRWTNEARGVAGVYCVIIGFSLINNEDKRLYDYPNVKGEPIEYYVKNINPYLVDGKDIVIPSRNNGPICNVPQMVYGNKPVDGGNLLLSDEEKDELIHNDPSIEIYIRPIISAKEYINGIRRWCFWLVDAEPNKLRHYPEILRRVENVRQLRLKSNDLGARKLAEKPTLFREVNNPETAIIIPCHSSETRKYIPMGFISKEYIVNNSMEMIPNATIFHFGILTSEMHMAWMRQVCGRLESRYRYSKDIVYNNFPWPGEVSKEKQEIVETAAKLVLDARLQFPDASLADLYNPLSMPMILVNAHKALDTAVDKCYRKEPFNNEFDRVQYLFNLYEKLTIELVASALKPKQHKKSKDSSKNNALPFEEAEKPY
jgi:hypothetical protein